MSTITSGNDGPGAIVVGMDLSENAADALRWAVAEGSAHGWPVVALLAWDFTNQHHLEKDAPFDPHYDGAKARAALDAAVKAAVGDGAGGVERQVICAMPAQALLDASEGANLLVVGARGIGGFRGLLLGSVSQHCLHHAKVPVAIVRGGTGAHGKGFGRIVVGVDGSDNAKTALEWAAEEARVRIAGLDIVHAWHLPVVGDAVYAAPLLDPRPFEEVSKQLLAEARATPDVQTLTTTVRTTSVCGGSAGALLDAAQQADLVVIGSRGVGGFAGLLLGSVSHQLAHHSPCPVVVIAESDGG